MDLVSDKVFALISSNEEFPVDFEDAWRWIGWTAKRTGKDVLLRNFEEGVDFLRKTSKNSGAGRPSDHLVLTIDCFKSLAMMAGTVEGKKVRRYFLDCERELKRRLHEEKKQCYEVTQKRLVAAMVSKDVVSRKPKFPLWFYEMLYRKYGRGWENRDPQKFRPACVGTWTNQTVYDRLLGGVEPGGVKDILNTVNPRQPNGVRKHRHHWHLKDLGEFHLQTHLYALSALANTVQDGDWDRFMRKVAQAFPNGEAIQLTLLDILEEMEEVGYPNALPT